MSSRHPADTVPAAIDPALAGRRSGVVVAVAATAWLVLNAVLLWLYHGEPVKPLIGDEFDYHRRALALLAGEAVPETYIWPPGQTGFLAALYRLFGPQVLVVQLVQIALLAACAWMLARLWQPVAGARAAAVAALLFLLNPTTIAQAHWLWPEVTHLACLLGALLLLFGPAAGRAWQAAAAGLLVGLALLLKSLLGAFWPLLLLAFVGRREGRLRMRTGAAALFIGGLLIATAPALWKGYLETGRPLIADSSIYNLDVGLADRSRSDYIDEAGAPALAAFLASAPTPHERNAVYRERIRETLARRGLAEVLADQFGTQYFRLFSAKTLLVSQLPGAACAGRLGAYRASALTPWLTATAMLWHAATLVACAFGIALWRRWREPLVVVVAAFLLYQLALYLGLHVMQRYLFQMLPFLCAFGGAALALRDREAASVLAVTPLRLALGSLLAITLLALALLGPWLDGNCR